MRRLIGTALFAETPIVGAEAADLTIRPYGKDRTDVAGSAWAQLVAARLLRLSMPVRR